MFRSILVCVALMFGSIGCVRAPIPITSVVHTEPTPISRQDLPTNWFEVKLSNISYGLPKDFDRLTLALSSEVLSRHHSSTQNLTIDCYVRNSTTDLHEYVLDNFILPRSGKVIAVREKTTGPKPIVVVQSVDGTTSSLDFFIQNNNTIYQLTCFGDAISLKTNSATCFKVIDTVRIQ